MQQSFLLSQLYAFLTVALWSSAYVFTKIELQYFSVSSLGLLHCLVASLCLALVVLREEGFRRQSLRRFPYS